LNFNSSEVKERRGKKKESSLVVQKLYYWLSFKLWAKLSNTLETWHTKKSWRHDQQPSK